MPSHSRVPPQGGPADSITIIIILSKPPGGSTAAPVFAVGGIGEVHAYHWLWRMKDRGRAVRIALALGIDSGNILGKFSAFRW